MTKYMYDLLWARRVILNQLQRVLVSLLVNFLAPPAERQRSFSNADSSVVRPRPRRRRRPSSSSSSTSTFHLKY